jgi:dTDP-4-dehydrorhamnose 3,5-epimerase
MMWQVERMAIDGPLILRSKVFTDDRGSFMETYNERAFAAATGIRIGFVQDNESISRKGVLRGLHFQLDPYAQGKLVRVTRGAALDVVVDIRPGSPTYGRHVKVRLDAVAKDMFWIPPGFAHGFLALEDDTVFAYKCTAYYHPAAERTIRWNDPDLAIDWGHADPIVSAKDRAGLPFNARWDRPDATQP